jgi:replicative DNA helicase
MFLEDLEGPVSEIIRKKSSEMLELLPFQHRKSYDKKSAVFEAREELKRLKERKGFPKISTGYDKLDRVTHGIPKGRMFIFGGRGKMGKTALTTCIGEEVKSQGYDVAYFSHEVKMNDMINRRISRKTGIDFRKFEYNPGGFTKREEEKIEKALKEIEGDNLYMESGRASSLDYLVSRSKQFKAMYPNLALIVFDGLQSYENLVPDRGNKSDFFTKVMSTMKYEIAEPLGLTVFLNAQLKQDVDTRYRKSLCKPRSTEDFSDCKGIKDVCDGAFGLWRGEYYFSTGEMYEKYKNKLEIIPLDLRNEDRHIKPFNLGINIKTMDVYEI